MIVDPLRLVLADDHLLFRQGLRSMLTNLHPDVAIVAEVDRVADVVPAITRTACDLLLLDLQMDRSALGEIAAFARRVRVVVVTASQRPADALAAIRVGARAVVFKRFAVETLMEAIRTVVGGHVWLPAALQDELAAITSGAEAAALTSREREIVRLVAQGFHNAEIAARLSISDVTVKSHINNIFRKLDVRDRVGLTLYALHRGLVEMPEQPPPDRSGDC